MRFSAVGVRCDRKIVRALAQSVAVQHEGLAIGLDTDVDGDYSPEIAVGVSAVSLEFVVLLPWTCRYRTAHLPRWFERHRGCVVDYYAGA